MMHLSPRAKRLLLRSVIWTLAVTAVAYGLDDLSARFGIPARPEFSTITIRRAMYINEKYNKFSIEPLPDGQEKCVNALAPHFGARPCWYARKHFHEIIEY